ncbi:hypothetical protein OH76DRAFT_1103064 [Lentinus brumalis]|uniref:Uncharacterized protein n=1 Tax=Lentinus brumalis TaxID=2498619 RepID=A0A371CVN0_9APHY|nr:hypothetical protein OH76DRAFT_1103064 [Polyporus brumalis]
MDSLVYATPSATSRIWRRYVLHYRCRVSKNVSIQAGTHRYLYGAEPPSSTVYTCETPSHVEATEVIRTPAGPGSIVSHLDPSTVCPSPVHGCHPRDYVQSLPGVERLPGRVASHVRFDNLRRVRNLSAARAHSLSPFSPRRYTVLYNTTREGCDA